jgi:3-oxoacyl-[acyl-carrier protein] reductase
VRLEGKVALVTGGARGIGREVAGRFADEGARVLVADRDGDAGRSVVEDLAARGRPAHFVTVDVTVPADVERCVGEAVTKFGRIDVLINNAGITADAWAAKMTDEQWDRVIAVNLTGAFSCIRAVLPPMFGQGSGSIINASSVVGVYGNLGQVNYAATKAGIIGMTRALARELGPRGIRVNAVAPGFIETDMTAKVPEKVLDLMRSRTPLGRLGRPADVAAAYVFLASDEAAYVTGQVLGVDGGLVI